MLFTETSGRFSPGRLIASEDLLACVAKEELLNAYCHHLNCDWVTSRIQFSRATIMHLATARLCSLSIHQPAESGF